MDIQRLLETQQNAVYGICFRVLRHPQDAEDACQDALVEAARHARDLRDPNAFGPWLRRVALTSALDLRRKRERRRLRDAGFTPPVAAADPDVELHQAIAELDDDTRWVVLEHYYEGRPLRTLASEAGVSEVAIWKRLEKGRERLRARLAPAVYATLGVGVLLTVPSGLVRKAFAALEATAAMKKIAIAALLLVPPALIGGAAVFSRPATPQAPRESMSLPTSTAAVRRVEAPPPAKQAAPKRAAKVVDVPPRKPWPLEFPPVAWPAGVRLAWEALTRRVTIDVQNAPLSELVAEISRQIQYPIALSEGLGGDQISFKVAEIVGDGALRLVLQPRRMGYELREDGTILVARQEKPVPDPWGAGKIWQAESELDRAQRALAGGLVPSLRTAEEGLKKAVVMPPGARRLEAALEALRDASGLNILVDAAAQKTLEEGGEVPSLRGGTVESLLQSMLVGVDLDPVPTPEGVVLLMTRARAFEQRNSPEIVAARRLESVLDGPLAWRDAAGVPGIAERLERDLQVRVITTREAWEGVGETAPLKGETARAFLDRLSLWGVRWTVQNGSLFLIR